VQEVKPAPSRSHSKKVNGSPEEKLKLQESELTKAGGGAESIVVSGGTSPPVAGLTVTSAATAREASRKSGRRRI
jgi:hypothetical protein